MTRRWLTSSNSVFPPLSKGLFFSESLSTKEEEEAVAGIRFDLIPKLQFLTLCYKFQTIPSNCHHRLSS